MHSILYKNNLILKDWFKIPISCTALINFKIISIQKQEKEIKNMYTKFLPNYNRTLNCLVLLFRFDTRDSIKSKIKKKKLNREYIYTVKKSTTWTYLNHYKYIHTAIFTALTFFFCTNLITLVNNAFRQPCLRDVFNSLIKCSEIDSRDLYKSSIYADINKQNSLNLNTPLNIIHINACNLNANCYKINEILIHSNPNHEIHRNTYSH